MLRRSTLLQSVLLSACLVSALGCSERGFVPLPIASDAGGPGATPGSPLETNGSPAGLGVSTTDAGPTTPVLTYQAPTSETTYALSDGNSVVVNPYQYAVPSGSAHWTPETTVNWAAVDLYSSSNLVPGTYTDANGVARLGYAFSLAQGQCPWWGCPPRVEVDSASPASQNPANGGPVPGGWSVGVLTSGMEMTFVWSVYFSSGFSTSQTWADFFQLHPGNTNVGTNGCMDYPNNRWPQLSVNGAKLGFGLGPDTSYDGWTDDLANYLGKWTDFAVHFKLSTGADGLMELYVNGKRVASQTGNNMPYCTTNGTPWYYVKQGYYRDSAITGTDVLYQTPLLVTQPVQ
jgi:hypothetical protein